MTTAAHCRSAFQPCTTSVTGDPGYWVYDHGAIAEHVDGLRIMAYDYLQNPPNRSTRLGSTGHRWRARGATREHDRVVLGIPSYGYNWPTIVVGDCPAGAPGRTSINPGTLDDLIALRNIEPVADTDR